VKRMSLGMVSLLLGAAALLADRASYGRQPDGQASAREPFVGAWRLVALEETGADGTVRRADATGMFVFSRDGRASVQVMYRSGVDEAGGPVRYAQGGYEASFGRYEVDAAARTFTYSVEGALVRGLVGKDLVRSFELSGRRLVVRSADPREKWQVTWERY
jgi:hypothetical protein